MSVLTSIKISRSKAQEIVLKKLNGTNNELRELVSPIVEDLTTFHNVYQVVNDGEENEDERIGR